VRWFRKQLWQSVIAEDWIAGYMAADSGQWRWVARERMSSTGRFFAVLHGAARRLGVKPDVEFRERWIEWLEQRHASEVAP